MQNHTTNEQPENLQKIKQESCMINYKISVNDKIIKEMVKYVKFKNESKEN